MALDTDNVNLVISQGVEQPAIRTDETSVRTVKGVYNGGNLYEIQFNDGLVVGTPKEVYVPVKRRLDFIRDLKEGDRVILVRSGDHVKLLSGPLDEERLYIDPRLNH